MKDYRVYHLNTKEKTEYLICASALCFCLGMLFYNSILISAALCIIPPFFTKKYAEYKCDKRRKQLLVGFKYALYIMSGSMASGRQMPQAIEDAAEQAEMFSGENSDIAEELKHILFVYNNAHGLLEELFEDLGERSGIEEIKLFASSYKICKKTGGDLEAVCIKSAQLLIDRIDYLNEVSAVLSEKKLDTVIMMAISPLILFFLGLTSYDYVEILYSGLSGRIIMTLSLLLMISAAAWSLKIMKLDL